MSYATACACMGPVGDCPCIRRSLGEPAPITEAFVAPDVFDLLPLEDKETINTLKLKAALLYLDSRK